MRRQRIELGERERRREEGPQEAEKPWKEVGSLRSFLVPTKPFSSSEFCPVSLK